MSYTQFVDLSLTIKKRNFEHNIGESASASDYDSSVTVPHSYASICKNPLPSTPPPPHTIFPVLLQTKKQGCLNRNDVQYPPKVTDHPAFPHKATC